MVAAQGCAGLIDIAKLSGFYAQMTGFLAGFAFTAMVVLLNPGAEDKRTRDEKTPDNGVLLTLFVALTAMVITTLVYSVLAGEDIAEARGRAATEELVNAIPFGLAVIMLFHGVTLLMHTSGRVDRTTILVGRIVTVVVIPALAMYYIANGASDTDSARAALDGTCATIRIDGLGVALTVILVIVLAASLLSRFQPERWQRRAREHRDAVPVAVLVVTVATALVAGELSTRSRQFLVSPMILNAYLVATFALLLFIGLALALGMPERDDSPPGAPQPPLPVPELGLTDGTADRIRERLREQARSHWLEFAAIVAGANVVLALVLLGRIAVGGHSPGVTAVSAGIAAASMLAVVLAYYSLQVGALMVFGPLRWTQVVASFLIAATQSALLLWPAHVLGSESRAGTAQLRELRHWLLFYAAFAVVAALTNWYQAGLRPGLGLPRSLARYEDAQRRDRIGAFVCAAVVTTCWVASAWLLLPALVAGIGCAAYGSTCAITSQARISERLPADLAAD
jgi:hypothetical protein